ncbi:hypothetical protein [Citrifermentans bremense]|uniref:hypothetical protein n=1 Tax=Citrifermentans bremense TaxID=60035 RepID=UPI0004081544|nr:hypothetical protein [Citrifermentans bremense]
MSGKVTFRISAAAAPYVGADKPRQQRLEAASGKVALPPADFVLLIYYLCHDQDQEVKRSAVTTLRALDAGLLKQVLADPELHPRILDALVQLHGKNPDLGPLFAKHPSLSSAAAAALGLQEGASAAPAPSVAPPVSPQEEIVPPRHIRSEDDDVADEEEDAVQQDEDEPIDEEEYQSKYQMAQGMGVSDKIKIAMTGDKEWRSIMIKDNNKLVSSAAIKNPRMTESEVLSIAKSVVGNDEIMRVICTNKEWIKNSQIRKALVMNSKTPLPHALRFVATLPEKELAQLAKSKNVNTAISSQARRMLMSKKDSR